MGQKRTNRLQQDWHTNKIILLRKCAILPTAHPRLSLGLGTLPGAPPVPSHCHLPVPARGWSHTLWMPASRPGDVSGRREGGPGDKGQAGLSHTEPSGLSLGWPGRHYSAPRRLHARPPPGLSHGTAGPPRSRPSIPSESRDVHRIRIPSLQKHRCPPAAAGRPGGDTSASPRSRRRLSLSVRPAGREGRGLWSAGAATY